MNGCDILDPFKCGTRPPLIRLPNLGVRQVPTDVSEAIGATDGQLLWRAPTA